MRRTALMVFVLLGLSACRDEPMTDLEADPPVVAQEPIREPAPAVTPGPAEREAPGRLDYEQNTIRVVREYQDGVVYVTRFDRPQQRMSLFGPLGRPDVTGEPQESGNGSGFFIDDDGFILTNYHVIEGAEELTVKLHNTQRSFPAEVIGVAPDYDLALLRASDVPRDLYVPMPLGNSDDLQVGQKAIAMGAPFGLEFSVTQGIVSALKRVIPTGVNQIPQNAIQTDAAINPGNSGGPLVDSEGRVIGINTQILSPTGAFTGVGQNAGVGFAIPINAARALLPRLRTGDRIGVPLIGVTSVELSLIDPSIRTQYDLPEQGLLVQEVQPGTPAAEAGLRAGQRVVRFADFNLRLGGDIITEIEGEPVDGIQDLRSVLITKQPGEQVTLTVQRGGREVQEELTLAEAPR